jgi:hypothetical protein
VRGGEESRMRLHSWHEGGAALSLRALRIDSMRLRMVRVRRILSAIKEQHKRAHLFSDCNCIQHRQTVPDAL